ncbi:MAG: endo-1,4-beta-xylanase [Actinomycetaceae bacterium]|nr:endo-1,4-beta-xylanase [Actinomycetaceae bacterium]
MNTHMRRALALIAGGALALTPLVAQADSYPYDPAPDHISLREAAEAKGLLIGTAVTGGNMAPAENAFISSPAYRAIVAEEFNSVTPENQMKWEHIHPERDRYDFAQADMLVEFAQANGQQVRGHTLLWHSQNPAWLSQGNFTDEELREILRDHITTVVTRYKGRIQQWDLANEIFKEDGSLRSEENIWIKRLGIGIVADAARWAHEADPAALLFLNDYNVDGVNAKSTAYYSLLQEYKAQGVPIHGFGIQGHLSTDYGFDTSIKDNLARFDALGYKTAITELDVRMTLKGAKPTPELLAKQADFYGQELAACLATKGCISLTIWGFDDAHSWVPYTFEGEGGANVLWEDYSAKPAYFRMLKEMGVEVGNLDVPQSDAPKTDDPKDDDNPQSSVPTPNTPQSEAPKPDAPKPDAPQSDKKDDQKQDAPKVDLPQSDKKDAPKADGPKADTPKADNAQSAPGKSDSGTFDSGATDKGGKGKSTPSSSLAQTGAHAEPLIIGALVAAVVGGGALFIARRKRS